MPSTKRREKDDVMTEKKWLEITNPRSLLRYLKGKGSERKLRLFAVAVHREYHRLESRFRGPASDLAADTAESLAESGGSFDNALRSKLGGYFILNPTAYGAASRLAEPHDVPDEFKCGVLRCLFGNPFQPVTLAPQILWWSGGTVLKVAQTVYSERRFQDLPVLADALEEAGCTNAAILQHCRGPRPHFRGCWVVDLILGKS
jgi:hypothetical protein